MNTRSRSACTAAAAAAAATDSISVGDGAVDAVTTKLRSVKISFSSKKGAATSEDERDETPATFTRTIVALVNKVYTTLGNAQLEKTYQRALLVELRKLRGVRVSEELSIDIMYDDEVVGHRYADIVVDFADGSRCILELKAVVRGLTGEHLKQLKYYMWVFKVPHGVLVNFPRMASFPDIDDDRVAGSFTLDKLQGEAVLSNITLRKRTENIEPEIHYVSNSEIVSPSDDGSVRVASGPKHGSTP